MRTVRRWATVMVDILDPDAPDDLVALGLHRARMCEMLAGSSLPEERETLFTIGLFSVADALLDVPMEDVLESLPFTEEIQAALLATKAPRASCSPRSLAYERGEFPTLPTTDSAPSLAGAYRAALEWADEAARAVAYARADDAPRRRRSAPRGRRAPPRCRARPRRRRLARAMHELTASARS